MYNIMRHSVALGISNCSVRRFLCEDLNFRQYKMAVAQELGRDRDMANRSTVTECLLGILSDDVVILMTD
jgi:hypothetical protein